MDDMIRASDAEREAAVAQLREHTADGRLTTEEFIERMDEAYSAKIRGELEFALRELPPLSRSTPLPMPRPAVAPMPRPPVMWPLALMPLLVGLLLFGAMLLWSNGLGWTLWPLLWVGLPWVFGRRRRR